MRALELVDGVVGATSAGMGVGRSAAAGVGTTVVAHVAVAGAGAAAAEGGSSFYSLKIYTGQCVSIRHSVALPPPRTIFHEGACFYCTIHHIYI